MKPQQSYLDKLLEWQQVRAAIGGKLTIDKLILCGCSFMVNPMYRIYEPIKTDDGYIPGNFDQVTKRQAAYWSRARYLNATRRTVDSLDGMVWSVDPEINIPTQLEYLNLRDIAQKATYETISIGRCGILVDSPSTEGQSVTIAERDAGKGNPMMIFFEAERIPFVRYSGDTLLEVRLLETYEEQVDGKGLEWEEKEQIRRLYLDNGGQYVVEIWRKEEIYQTFTPSIKGQRLNYIPFQFLGADDNSPEMTDAPIYDIASENLGHYMLSADNRDNLHYHGQGMTNVYSDMDAYEFNSKNPNGLDVGAGGRNLLGQEDRVEILQIEATGAIPAEMERVEKRMMMLGAQLLQTDNTNETLGAKEIDTEAQTSTLKRIATNVSLGITQCLVWCAEFLSIPSTDISYKLNTRYYTDSLTFQDVQLVWQMTQGGMLPKEALNEINRRKGYTKLDDEEIDEKINDGNIGGVSENEAILQARIEELEAQLAGGE